MQQTRGNRPATARWVKALTLGALIVVAVLVVVMLMAGGEHGPGRHGGSIGSSGSVLAMPDR